MPRPGRQPIVDLLKPLLKEWGFRKDGQNWRRTVGDFIHLFNLQASQFSDKYFFNAGIYIRSLSPLEKPLQFQCAVRRRSDSFLRDERGIPDVLAMDREMPWENRSRHITRLAFEAVEWMEWISSREAILQVLEDRKTDKRSHPRVSVCRQGYEYVGIPLIPPQPISKVTLMFEGEGTTINVGDKAAIKTWAKRIVALKPKQ